MRRARLPCLPYPRRETAAKCHTARFILVPALRDELTVPVPTDQGPGKKWRQSPEVAPAAPATNGTPIRIGYARCSTAAQELQSQLDALAAMRCTRVFPEKINTRIKIRLELQKAPDRKTTPQGAPM